MRILHVGIEIDEGWYCAHGLEDPSVITQGRTLDEIVANVREVVELLYDEKQVHIELVLPPGAQRKPKKRLARRRTLVKAR